MIKCSTPRVARIATLIFTIGLPSTALVAAQVGLRQGESPADTTLPMKVGKSIHFREIGPAIAGGRVSAVVGVAGKLNIYYVGAADGGIFRTEDGGVTWQALFQHQSVASIGALAVDPQNPAVIWAGTGEASVRNDVSYGDGIYKSTDAGLHWKHLGLDHTFQISRIAIDPLHPARVLVAAMGSPWKDNPDRGVYRTTDGGASWEKVLYVGPRVGISDLVIDPMNPEVVLAGTYRFRRTPGSFSEGGPEDAIYKSTDGGATWKRLSGNGLPEQQVSRIGLAFAPSTPNVVYAIMGSKEGVLWRSEDEGEHWSLVNTDQELDSRPFYFSNIDVDPTDPNHVFALSDELHESNDGGRSFHTIAKKLHTDYHAMWIDPAGSGRIIDGSDGGVALSFDNGTHWSFLENLAIGQFYHVATAASHEACGGLQDNATWCGPSQDKNASGILNRAWFDLKVSDGFYAIPATDNPNLIYSTHQDGAFFVFDRTDQQIHNISPYPHDFLSAGVADLPYRFNWGAAFAVSPTNAKVLYAGGNVVFKSDDRGRTWQPISGDLTHNDKSKQASSGGPVSQDNSGAEFYDTIITIAPAPSDPKVIWVGTDDGEVQVTRNGGTGWTSVGAHIPKLPAWGRVESIDVSANDPGDVLIAVDRHFSGDFMPYLFRTKDYGEHWSSIAGNLPSGVYAHVVRRDLRNSELYYAGLENGLYVSWDAGKRWCQFGLGLPDTAVYDLALNPHDSDLVVATHGRALWVLDDLTPFQDYDRRVIGAPFTLFHSAGALRFWPRSPVMAQGDGAFYGQNPSYGAALSYYVSRAAKAAGQLVITDSSGKPVRRTPVSGDAGLHRVYWDLRTNAPVCWKPTYSLIPCPQSGALVPPGVYTASLTIDGQTVTQPLTVRNDPLSHGIQSDILRRYEVTESVLHEISQLDVALNRLEAIKSQVHALEAAVRGSPDDQAVNTEANALDKTSEALISQIATNKRGDEERVHDHLIILDFLLEGEDDAPTAALMEQKTSLDLQYRAALQAYDGFLAGAVARFNRTMATDKLTGVVTGSMLSP